MGLDNSASSPAGSLHRFKNISCIQVIQYYTLLATCVEIQTSLGALQKAISSVSTPQEFVCKRHIFQALLSVAAAIRKIPELQFQKIPSISHIATDPTKNIVMRFQACLTEVVNKMAVLREYLNITNALSIGQILQVIKDKLILIPPEPTPIDSATATTTTEDEDDGDDEDTYYDAQQDVQNEPTLPPRRDYPIISVTIPSSNPLSSSDSPVSTSSSSSPSSTPSSSSSPPPLHLESLLATSRSEPGLGHAKPPTLQKYLTSPELTNRREVGMKKSFSLFNMNIKKGPRPEQEIHVFNPLYGKKIDYGLISKRIKEGKLKQSYNVTTKLFRNSYKYNTPQDWLSPIKPDQTTRSIFGTPLNLVPSTTKGVPLFLEEAFHYLQSIQDLDFQSLVQSQVPLLEVLQYQKGIERGMKLETLPVDPPLVFALIKQFLSLLPDSLICLSIYHDVIQLQGVTPLQTKLSLLKDIILSLPLNHIYSLQLIIQFLNEISLHLSLSSSASAISSLSIPSLSRSQSSSPSSSPGPSPRVSSSPVPSPRLSSPSSSPHVSRSSPRNVSQDKRQTIVNQSIVNQPSVNSPMQSSGSYSKSKKSISSTFAPLLLRKDQDHAAKVDIINTMIHNYNYLFETRTPEMAYEVQAGAYIVVSASPRMVAQKLVDPFYSEPDFVDAILLTYSYFSTATELLNMMISIILYVINLWLQRNILRLKGDGDFCQTLSKFGSITSPSPSEKPFFSFLHQWIKKNYSPHATLKSTKSKMMSTPARYTSFLEFGVDHIAHQMIYIDNKLFRAMKFSDFLHKNFVTPSSSPGFTLMMQRFNLWGGWVASEIVSEKVQSSRAKIISFFIRVAQVCLEMQSYNTAYAVIAGLGNSSVERLRLTWELIDDDAMEMYSKLQEVFDMSKNYLNYRTVLHNSVPPLVPYLGLYPKDLFAIEENLPGRTNDNLVQITKLRKLHEVIRPLLDYQLGKNYVIKSDRVAHQYLKKINPLDSEAIYQYRII